MMIQLANGDWVDPEKVEYICEESTLVDGITLIICGEEFQLSPAGNLISKFFRDDTARRINEALLVQDRGIQSKYSVGP